MNVAPAVLADRLAAAGAGTVEGHAVRLARYGVDGKEPVLHCTPDTTEQIAAIVRTCAEASASIVPWGGGTAMALGNIPRSVDVVIELTRLDHLVEHDAANLTATVQAGMRLGALQQILERQQQFLALDPPHPADATVGGVVAANCNGPRRMLYGGIRDLVIGMKMVLATGEQIKAGGKVVKNVAGYDMCKLFVGSLGTLGIITEVTMKMTPVPERSEAIVTTGPLPRQLRLLDPLFASTLLPAAVVLLSPSVAQASGFSAEPAVVVWAEGFAEAADRHVRDLRAFADRVEVGVQVLGGSARDDLWVRVRDFGADGAAVVFRLTVPLSDVAQVVTTIEDWGASTQAMRYIAHVGTGVIWVSLEADPESMGWFPRLVTLAQERGGHAVMTTAPPGFKAGIDVWGPPPPSLDLMREIKRQFDPQGILNPGRFVSGI